MADNTGSGMNERIRRERSLTRQEQPRPEPEPEPMEPPPDLGAGPRRSVEGSDPDAFRKWLSQQVHRSKLESVTVNADLDSVRRKP